MIPPKETITQIIHNASKITVYCQTDDDTYEIGEDIEKLILTPLGNLLKEIDTLQTSHDDLLAACESWVKVLEFHTGFVSLVEKTKQAIAKVENQESRIE